MVKVSTYFAMTFAAFLFWESMDKVHVWNALHQDEKVRFQFSELGFRFNYVALVFFNRAIVPSFLSFVLFL